MNVEGESLFLSKNYRDVRINKIRANKIRQTKPPRVSYLKV